MTTQIEWTDIVWNPTTGCDKVSPGCGLPRFEGDDVGGCYAMAMAKRLKGMGQAKYQNDGDPRTSGPGFGVTMHPDALSLPLRWRKPKRIFVNSMSDLFHEKVSDEFIARVFAVMAHCSHHTFQILTKRHARMRSLLSASWFPELVTTWAWRDGVRPSTRMVNLPARNVWLGVSTEDQKWADIRIPALLDTPAAVRWISAEPLLGPIDLGEYLQAQCLCCDPTPGRPCVEEPVPLSLDWVVAGGESGPNARPMKPAWPRWIREQCADARVPFLFKQWGGRTPKAGGRALDGRTWDEYPVVVS
jgi:protein gp37